MEHVADLAVALGTLFVGMVSPGPNFLAIAGTSMRSGRAAGRTVAWGVIAGTVGWGTLTTTGLSALIAADERILTAIEVIGGAYLLWIAARAFRSAYLGGDRSDDPEAPADRRGRFRRGFLVQMTNPKAALVWVAIVSIGVDADSPLWVPVALVLGAIAMSVAVHTSFAVLFSTRRMVAAYHRAGRWIDLVLGTVFALIGFRLLWAAFG